MGTLKNGILGGVSGKVGPVVGASWKGLHVLRSRPPRKRRKSSEAQLRQMSRVRLMSPFLRPLTPFLNRTYPSVGVNMSSYNKAFSYNVRNAIDGTHPEWRISYTRFLLGMGDLIGPDKMEAGSMSPGTIQFSWTDNSGEGSARWSDQFFVAIYNEELDHWIMREGAALRNAGSCTLEAAAFSGKAVHPYTGFSSADSKFVSTSLYTGLVNVL